ncbi:MAG TPA: HTH domain-containing protein, partial [Macellibacteroides fermentans]|uniref:HTH domain-containing protein n=1 Tax=Macellibacteroides fermentans TaxID=879969 RepID=UPI002C30EDBC|nr:HTH domain-containing protein [Macellibacteroides fermentans]
DKLTENQKLIVTELRMNHSISLAQLSKKIGISQTAVENNINKLRKGGIFKLNYLEFELKNDHSMSLKRKNIRTTPTTITPILTYTDLLLTNSRSQNRLVSEQKKQNKS